MLATYALELHALKAELQSTLARLGIDPASSESDSDPSNLPAGAETAVTVETRRRLTRSRLPARHRPITRWNRRQLTQELSAASQRRRELELQLQREMDTQESDTHEQQQEQDSRHRTAWQAAMTALQQQRAEILRQIEQDTAVDTAVIHERGDTEQREALQETEQSRQSHAPPPRPTRPPIVMGNTESVSENQYSIGGVVTLEPLSSSQRGQASTLTSSRSGVEFRPVLAPPVRTTALPPALDTYPRYRNTPDALNDVFSLQLKFAETMLKLEKSVQMRDQLLQPGRTSSVPKRRTGTQTREDESQAQRRRTGRQLRRSESGSNSDSSVIMYREIHSSESFSSSVYSISSLDSTPHRGQTIRVRYPSFGVSRATTAETLADNSPGSETTDGAAPVSSAMESLHESPHAMDETAEDDRHIDSEAIETTGGREEEVHKTPTTGSSNTTTPTTGSDQKSNTSSTKQVRFGEDAYSTPVLARKFNFDGPSIDDDDYEGKEEEAESVLSFLGGSSVSSAELNDASFLRAFERFRRELNGPRQASTTMQPPLARKLFPATCLPSDLNDADTVPRVSERHQCNAVGSTAENDGEDHTTEFDGLSVEELQELRRQLCLDIQAESAQLVLNFSARQSVTTRSHDAENTKNQLLALRDKLKAVDARLSVLQWRGCANLR